MDRMLQFVRKIAPAATAGILLFMIVMQSAGTTRVPGADRYFERVREVVESIPYKIGDGWLGRDIETPPAAVRLLRPNVVLHRLYEDLETGRAFSLLIVHCGNVRDMTGHYPPNCYPAHGWNRSSTDATQFEFSGTSLPATDYVFSRVSGGIESRMRILNFFILPDDSARIFGDYGTLDRASRGRRTAALGAAQVQIIGGETLSAEEHAQVVQEFIATLGPTIQVVGEGVAE